MNVSHLAAFYLGCGVITGLWFAVSPQLSVHQRVLQSTLGAAFWPLFLPSVIGQVHNTSAREQQRDRVQVTTTNKIVDSAIQAVGLITNSPQAAVFPSVQQLRLLGKGLNSLEDRIHGLGRLLAELPPELAETQKPIVTNLRDRLLSEKQNVIGLIHRVYVQAVVATYTKNSDQQLDSLCEDVRSTVEALDHFHAGKFSL